MRTRLRARSDVNYQVARTNEEWPDHVLRTLTTAAHIAWLRPESVIDPACGDGSIVSSAALLHSIPYVLFGDVGKSNIANLFIPATYSWEKTCDDVDALLQSQADGTYDVVVLTEILEHLVDPEKTLREARRVGKHLVASSPEMRDGQVDYNPEHLWMFDADGYRQMLVDSGWVPQQKTSLAFPELMYDFQIWVCD